MSTKILLFVVTIFFTGLRAHADDVRKPDRINLNQDPLGHRTHTESQPVHDAHEDTKVETLLPKFELGTRTTAQEVLDAGKNYTTFGHQSDNPYLYGRAHIINNIQNVADVLAKNKIIMSIGFISRKGGGDLPGLKTHKQGKEFNLKYIFDDGSGGFIGRGGTPDDKGYNRAKTLEMLKTFVDSAGKDLQNFIVGDPALATKLQEYVAAKGITVSTAPGSKNWIYVGYSK
jgi:hypothetical protein